MPSLATTGLVDRESAAWLRALGAGGAAQEAAAERLHALLIRVAFAEVRRRSAQLAIDGPELDDVAHQAAADALVAITGKLAQFRGESRFTTWAYKFVMFEVSKKVGRHFWQRPQATLEAEDWERLPGRFGFDPAERAEWNELVAALRRAVDEVLTDRQRRMFVAIVLNGVPLDVVATETGTNRNAIYKTLFDARSRLRAALVAGGHLEPASGRTT